MKTPPGLIPAAEKAIRECVKNSNTVHGTGEVAEVARLVLELPTKLVREWTPYLKSGSLDIVGIFSHKTPKARWFDSRDKKPKSPELCDLLLVVECLESGVRNRRAMVIQAKLADANATAGQFTVSKGGPEIQRFLYTFWPQFTLTGLKQKPTAFNIKPKSLGKCKGTRYGCINVNALAPQSGWWIETTQPLPPLGFGGSNISVSCNGTFDAKVPLGQALHDMVNNKLGAALKKGNDWERLVTHLTEVASQRTTNKMPPPDVEAAGSTALPHRASASLYMTNPAIFYKSTNNNSYMTWFNGEPPNREKMKIVVDGKNPGMGIIYISLESPEWHMAAEK
ncbi:hypothetical protein [Undibacterium sp. TJN19]|uniref:hypothetical protein n=1 Tax=Undibacterium sp. TJN19 TaxID=3413055 RepID=UPI003BF3EF19